MTDPKKPGETIVIIGDVAADASNRRKAREHRQRQALAAKHAEAARAFGKVSAVLSGAEWQPERRMVRMTWAYVAWLVGALLGWVVGAYG